jgi:acyl-CoA thioester hydrolase
MRPIIPNTTQGNEEPYGAVPPWHYQICQGRTSHGARGENFTQKSANRGGKSIISSMSEYNYYYPIEVRYGDLDPQGHVNNAKYLTYMEQARVGYIRRLGVWKGDSFLDIGIILADARVTFRSPILFGMDVRVGVRVTKLGNKSLTMQYRLENGVAGLELATGESVLVAYDYRSAQTIPVPGEWRAAIRELEGSSLPA